MADLPVQPDGDHRSETGRKDPITRDQLRDLVAHTHAPDSRRIWRVIQPHGPGVC